ncbi:ABC transporter substrate-binding protein [Rhodopseudomonas sp. RCAM05734]|uniref:ABC transporter substrate-binding protein n=1 Tax=Rhodopseudomonas sp. RCAM05734 TaxID=3457549 RepID=UPI004043DDCD
MMKLRVLLGDHPHTAALKSGAIASDLVEMDFAQYTPTNKGFKPMVRDGAFDVSELAIVTFLMAKAHNKPMVMLPDVMMARFQHSYAVTNPAAGIATPRDLEGKRVGIRSFTTTTGAWLRGILANDYGVNLDAIDWITFEDPHVAEYIDATTKAPAGKQIMQMLFDGELDAVLGEKSDDPRVNQAVSRRRNRGESLVRQARRGAGQPCHGSQQGAVRQPSRYRPRGASHAAGEQGVGCRQVTVVQRRRADALDRTDHRIFRTAGADPPCLCDR